jgi:TPR repeat protein
MLRKQSAILAAVLAHLWCHGAQAAKPAPKPAHPAPANHARTDHKPLIAELAAKGNIEAQYQLGLAALAGKGRAKNVDEALGWLALAGSYGHAAAALEVARLYEQRGNLAAAGRWLHHAGRQGDHEARTHFIDLYLDGRIGDIGGSDGAGWLAERAASGDLRARMALGDIYQQGRDVPVDLRQAERWYLEAALDGNVEAMVRLGRLQLALPGAWRAPAAETGRDGKWSGPVLYPSRPEAPDLGRAAIAADNRIDDKQLVFVRPGMVEGERWLRRAARRGDGEAAYILGKACVEGIDLPLDLVAGIGWLQAAAARDHAEALALLGSLAAKGKDPVRAWAEYDLAAGLGAKGAEAARERLAKSMNPRQVARARQIVQEYRETTGR